MQLDEIQSYEAEDLFWVQATQKVSVTKDRAWDALEPLLLHMTDIPTIAGSGFKIRKTHEDTPLLTVGNEIFAKAAFLGGLFQIPMYIRISQVRPKSYLELSVAAFEQHFANLDYRIETLADGYCRLSYRQGYRSHETAVGWMAEHVTYTPHEVPETLNIFNRWLEISGVRDEDTVV